MAQASMETDEGINSNINANDLPITNEVAINATLPLEVVIESNSPTGVEVPTDTRSNGEEKNKESELISNSITSENLFDIQINDIDAKLARFDEDLTIKGKTVWVINGMSNTEVPNLAPPINSKGSHKSTSNQGKFFPNVAKTSKHSQNSANPNPKCQKKNKKRGQS